jgi:hypothetical protein
MSAAATQVAQKIIKKIKVKPAGSTAVFPATRMRFGD